MTMYAHLAQLGQVRDLVVGRLVRERGVKKTRFGVGNHKRHDKKTDKKDIRTLFRSFYPLIQHTNCTPTPPPTLKSSHTSVGVGLIHAP
jgi:hypothetical protein